MLPEMEQKIHSFYHQFMHILGMAVGAFLAALAIRMFLIPHHLIDGGVVGIALILGRLFGDNYLSYFLLALNLPFIYLAAKYIRKSFVFQMLLAVLFFAGFLFLVEKIPPFSADILEVIVIGGALLGIGVGMIIRHGGCTDGTEILAILMQRKKGFTVGQTVLFINIFIFAAYGWIFDNWHIALRSLMTYMVAFKMIDVIIAGLDEMKSVMLITSKPEQVKEVIVNKLKLGLTIIPGIGGFSGETRQILFIIVERLDLSELKEIVLNEDPTAFMAIENLYEVAYGRQLPFFTRKKKKKFF